MKKFFQALFVKRSRVVVAMLVIMSGIFLSILVARADVSITTALGGTNISLDTTSNASCAGTSCYAVTHTGTALSPIVIVEGSAGDIAVGTHTLTAPAGWNFDPTIVTISKSNGTSL